MYNDFIISESNIFNGEVKIISPDVFSDSRGKLFTDYLNSYFKKHINESLDIVHSKFAYNKKNVLRGIHGDFKSYKIVQCVYGKIFQVVVDCRKDSPNYLKYDSFVLSHNNPQLIVIPPGFGNAFQVLNDFAVYNYKLAYIGNYNDFDQQFTYKWNDKRINIEWPIKTPVLSERDK